MENKINIVEILKDCPKGTELYSPVCGKCNFSFIQFADSIIKVSNKTGVYSFAKDGTYTRAIDAECLLFPSKDNRDWSTFRKPFKDGDILTSGSDGCKGNPFIFKQINSFGNAECYCAINCFGELIFNSDNWTSIKGCKLATKEEKQKLFDAIKANGYKWNPETKTLEKLSEPKFKVGDRVKHISACTQGIIVKITDKGYHIDYPKGEGVCYVSFTLEKDYELAPNKFDINTLKPFDKVLMRSSNAREWVGTFYSHYSNNKFYGCGMCCDQCVPYERNEHLLGKTGDCDEYFKNW